MKGRKLICLLLALLMLFPLGTITVLAETQPDSTASKSISSVNAMLLEQVSRMHSETETTLTIDTVKEIHDFEGNLYYAVEFFDSGYLICHAASGRTLEYSTSASSPYSNLTDRLYYCGPTQYYTLVGETYVHTITGDTFSTADTELVPSLMSASEQLSTACVEEAGGVVAYKSVASPKELQGASVTLDDTKGVHYISGYQKIFNLKEQNQMGYPDNELPEVGDGLCGYVAAAILLYWFDEGKGVEEAINDFAYLQRNKSGYRNENLTLYLRRLGKYSSTAAVALPNTESMNDVLSRFASKRHLAITTNVAVPPAATAAAICNQLNTYNAPVIVFGNIFDPRKTDGTKFNHAVLAYGWYDDQRLVVHFGWENLSHIVIDFPGTSAILGSYLCVTSLKPGVIYLNDIPANDWAYTAAKYCKQYGIIDNGLTRFDREKKITRGAFVNAMYELAGAPIVRNAAVVENKFTDFTASTAYHDAIVWAYQNGILTGTSGTTLAPSDGLTREQSAVFLYRFSTHLGCSYTSTSGPSASSFSDYSTISTFAKTAMDWATRRYLLQGTSGCLNPKNTMRRDEAAQLVYNVILRASY